MLELLRRDLGVCVAVVAVSERSEGDMHPLQVSHETLVVRQMAAISRRWVMLDQVHGVEMYRSHPDTALTSIVGVGDVLVGEAPIEGRVTRPVAVWAADCAPVMMFDRQGVPVACHAGWRGLAAGVIDVAVAAVAQAVVAILALARHDIDVVIGGACTACAGRWFSHRRGDIERHAMVGWSEAAQ